MLLAIINITKLQICFNKNTNLLFKCFSFYFPVRKVIKVIDWEIPWRLSVRPFITNPLSVCMCAGKPIEKVTEARGYTFTLRPNQKSKADLLLLQMICALAPIWLSNSASKSGQSWKMENIEGEVFDERNCACANMCMKCSCSLFLLLCKYWI